MYKDILKPYKFYYWKESLVKKWTQEDICFIYDINDTMAGPHHLQCNGIEIQAIKSDLKVGLNYNYHYRTDDKSFKYLIKEISIDDIDKKMFFDWLFNNKSGLHNSLKLKYEWDRNERI